MNNKQNKLSLQVRNYEHDKYGSKTTYTVTETIKRKLWAEQIGNFNPIFCRYKGKRTLVHSDEGDISDPFRRDETYTKTLYIEQT